MPRIVALALIALFVLAGCGSKSQTSAVPTSGPSASGSSPAILPLLVSAEILKGPNRFLFSLTDRQNQLVAAPEVAVHLKFYDVDTDSKKVVFEGNGQFFWAIEGTSGLYRAAVDFPKAGRWGTLFEATFPDGRKEAVRADYDVAATGTTPALGAKVPSVDTPTLADVGGNVKALTTDKAPVNRLYETSIADALAAAKPFVVSFATPAFCQTRTCGPTLDIVKTAAAKFPELTFINVEPYKMAFKDGSLQPELSADNQLQAASWTDAFGLKTEPYTLLIKGDGTVAAKFEGVMGADELEAALGAL